MKKVLKTWIPVGWRFVGLLILAVGFSARAWSDSNPSPDTGAPLVFRVYALQRTPAPEWVDLLREVSSPAARIIAGQHAELYVRATPADHALIAEMLKALDRPVRNVRIVVTTLEDVSERQRDIGVAAAGEITIGGTSSSRIQMVPRIEHSDTQSRSLTAQTLLTIDGGSASLYVGEEIPHADWIIQWGREWGYFEQQIHVQTVGAFLTVEPHILGNGPMIRIRLTPELRYRAEQADPRSVRFTRLSTEVTVQDGQTLDLGGLLKESEFYRRFLVGRDRAGRIRTQRIQLSPRIE